LEGSQKSNFSFLALLKLNKKLTLNLIMRPITITLRKLKMGRKKLIWIGIALAVVLVFVGGYFLAQRVNLTQINLAGLLANLKTRITPKSEEVAQQPQEQLPQIKIEPQVQPKVYEEVAKPGDGITHLARRALKEYLQEKGQGSNLTPEHKIYIEDYLQKKTGDYWLKIGQKLTFSEELIKEAIQKAETLTPEQLQNLTQYAKLVPELNY